MRDARNAIGRVDMVARRVSLWNTSGIAKGSYLSAFVVLITSVVLVVMALTIHPQSGCRKMKSQCNPERKVSRFIECSSRVEAGLP